MVCCPPIIKNIEFETTNHFFGHVFRILVGSFKSVGITKIGHY
jgi:hypothetical protein